MKNILSKVFICTLLLIFAVSCEDSAYLDIAPYSFTSPENYYETLTDFENALVGCYDAINTNSIAGNIVEEGTYAYGLQFMLNGGNDELIISSSPGTRDFTAFAIASYNSSNLSITEFWIAYFAGVMRCNYIIEEASSVTLDDNEKDRLTEIVSEAHFLRAFYYFHLAELFGGVPLNESAVSNSDSPRESLEIIYNNLIIPDLKLAYTTLPGRASIQGRANKWTAAGYLGVIYNYLASCKRYDVGADIGNTLNSFSWVDADQMSLEAKTILKDVIDNSQYHLVNKYDYLFRETTKSYQYEECLFLAECANVIADEYPLGFYQFSPGYSSKGGSYGIYRSPAELYNSYNSGDSRRNHNITINYSSNTENIEGVSYYVPGVVTNANSTSNYPAKIRNSNPDTGSRVVSKARSGVSYPLLRFADILLQYAEALYFTGDEETARTYFTPIRQRIVANGTNIDKLNSVYYKEDFIEELLDERKRELCFESKRRVDLIRFGKLTEAIYSINVNAGGANTYAKNLQSNWENYKIWFPIPIREINLNKNLIQNTGY